MFLQAVQCCSSGDFPGFCDILSISGKTLEATRLSDDRLSLLGWKRLWVPSWRLQLGLLVSFLQRTWSVFQWLRIPPCVTVNLQLAGLSGCEHKRCGFNPWVGKIPWRRAWQPTAVFLPEESHGQRSLVGCGPYGRKRVGHDWSDLAHSTKAHVSAWGVLKAKMSALFKPALGLSLLWFPQTTLASSESKLCVCTECGSWVSWMVFAFTESICSYLIYLPYVPLFFKVLKWRLNWGSCFVPGPRPQKVLMEN